MEEKELLGAIKAMFEEQSTRVESMLSAMQSDITTIKNDVKGLDTRMASLEDKVQKGFQSTRSELVEAVETVGHKVEHLERTVKDVQNVTAQNAYDVQLMRRQA